MHRSIIIDLSRANLLIHNDTVLHRYTSLVKTFSHTLALNSKHGKY